METQVKVRENMKCCGNWQAVGECLYSILSWHQQLLLVLCLCLHQVIEMQFLTKFSVQIFLGLFSNKCTSLNLTAGKIFTWIIFYVREVSWWPDSWNVNFTTNYIGMVIDVINSWCYNYVVKKYQSRRYFVSPDVVWYTKRTSKKSRTTSPLVASPAPPYFSPSFAVLIALCAFCKCLLAVQATSV